MTISVVCNDHDGSFSICAGNICNRKFPAKKKETGTRQTVQNNVTVAIVVSGTINICDLLRDCDYHYVQEWVIYPFLPPANEVAWR